MRLARRAEGVVERLFHQDGPPILQPYLGYAEPDALVLQGRVLSSVRRGAPEADQSRWTNFKQMMSLFVTSEVADVEVRSGDVVGTTNAEGYVTLRVPRAPSEEGLVTREAVLVEGGEPVEMPAIVPNGNARFGVISDIDDTMMQTGAHNLAKNLWTTFTGNTLTRQIFPDARNLMAGLHDGGRNPVFYVSSSPWNLHDFLTKIFARADLPRGPMFLRDLGVSETSVVGASHQDHKGAAVDAILTANPTLNFVLLGDTGQKDAVVYRDAVKSHPGRILSIILREPVEGSARTSLQSLLRAERLGVPTHHARNFRNLPDRVLPEGISA